MSDSFSDEQVDSFINQVVGCELDLNFWGTIADVFKYQGFDPRVIMRILMSHEKNKQIFARDMQVLCVWVESRGTRISREKVIRRTGTEGVELIRKLQTKYNIRDIVPDSTDTVTLARIVACFPQLVAKIRMTTVNIRTVGEIPEGLPAFLCFPGAAALFGTDARATQLWSLWMQWNINFDKVINPKTHNAEKVRQYADIVRNSSVVPQKNRPAILAKLEADYQEVMRTGQVQIDRNMPAFKTLTASLATTPAASSVNDKETQSLNRTATLIGSQPVITLGSSLFGSVVQPQVGTSGSTGT